MADPAVVQSTPISATAVTSITPSLPGVTAGNLLVMVLWWREGSGGNTSMPTIVDSSGQTWLKADAGGINNGSNWGAGYILYLPQANAGAHNLTVTSFGSQTWVAIEGMLIEFSNVTGATPLDVHTHVQNGAAASSISSGSVTSTARDLIIVVGTETSISGVANANFTDPPAGFTSLRAQQNSLANVAGEAAWQVGNAGNYSATWTFGGDSGSVIQVGVIAAFVSTGAAPVNAGQSRRRRHPYLAPSGSSGGSSGSGSFFPNANFSVSGNFADGGALTITSALSALPVKPTPHPQWWFDFAGGVLAPNATYSASALSSSFNGSTWASGAASGIPNAPGASFGDLTQTQAVGAQTDVLGNAANGTPSTQMYLCVVKVYNYNPGIATNYNTNLKSFRVWSQWPVGGGNNNGWIDENCNNNGGGVPGGAIIAFQNGLNSLFPGGPIPQQGVIYVEEILYQNNSALGTQDGFFQHWRNGAAVGTPSHLFTNASSGASQFNTVMVLDQISNNIEPAGAGVYHAWDMRDNTWIRAMWSPEPTWNVGGATYRRTPLLCTSSAAGSWGVINRLGINANLLGQYLYVVDASNNGIQIGQYHA